ncbi:MAG: hypothetical protein SF123_14185 [Chloroflexota bacterium]|nr:hypothetical protein [Chloroflexota bacterium]
MADNPQPQDRLKQAISAAQRGDKTAARRLLQQVLSEDKNNEIAWMWMASVVDTVDERRVCLQRALKINPNNARAQEALRRLGGVPAVGTSSSEAAGGIGEVAGAAVNTLRRGGNRTLYFALAGVLALVILVVVISSLLPTGPSDEDVRLTIAASTSQAAFATQAAVVILPTPIRETPTPTALRGLIVTLAIEDANLPATFTPTPTETPLPSPTPSATPFPLSGFSVLYTSSTGGAQPSLFSVNSDGSDVETLLPDFGLDVAYSPDGQQVAFVRGLGAPDEAVGEGTPTSVAPSGVLQVYIASVNDLANARPVTQSLGTAIERPVWTPDGRQIVYSSNADSDFDLYAVNADGSGGLQLTDNDTDDTDPVVSPDGTRVVYASDVSTPGSLEIFSVPITGGEPTQLTDASGSSRSPAFSPDGQRIAFASDRNGDSDIWMMDADGQRPFLVTIDDGGAEDRSPVWTPDGRWIAFISNRDGAVFQVYMITLDGAALVQVTDSEDNVQSISMQPMTLP